MSSPKYISSSHIQKLGHNILEIRERALQNIVSKLDNGILFDNDLSRTRELIEKLFQWFLFEHCTHENVVLTLLDKIIQSESGRTLINHSGSIFILNELKELLSYISPKYAKVVENLINFVERIPIVPPLETDVPLSYRTDTSSLNGGKLCTAGSTASPIIGYVQKEPSVVPQLGLSLDSQARSSNTCSDGDTRIEGSSFGNNAVTLTWQVLIESDRNVLNSIEETLRNPKNYVDLVHCCDFFTNVLLNDFPAEIFLQRPSIVLEFLKLVQTCNSRRFTNAILNCLVSLTKKLQIRIQHFMEPSMCNAKLETLSDIVSNCASSPSSDAQSVRENVFESTQEIGVLQNNQITVPDYCFQCICGILKFLRAKKGDINKVRCITNQVGFNTSLSLLDELLILLCLTIDKSIWRIERKSPSIHILRGLNDSLVEYGETLEYFRLESSSLDHNIHFRAIYLHLLHSMSNFLVKFVPSSKSTLILPKNCKIFLTNALVDVTLSRLYPELHEILVAYVKTFNSEDNFDSLKKYSIVNRVCKGITATIQFLKEYKTVSTVASLNLAKTALPSLEFHKNMDFLHIFIDTCSEKLYLYADNQDILTLVEEIILGLLSHHLLEIRRETYRLCHEKVMDYIATKHPAPSSCCVEGSQIYFLLSSSILTEMALFGIDGADDDIRSYADDIILHIVKCKILVSETIWCRIIEILIPTLPILCCHAGKTQLGRSIVAMMDPDTSKTLDLPDIVMLKCNLAFLYSPEAFLREEAFSRITWLMANQSNSRELLPKINSLYDRALANVCRLKRLVDVNKLRCKEHFYQPSNLQQVLDLLIADNIEPVIRRSALNQLSVMLEDSLLHDIFLEKNYTDLLVAIMESALTEQCYTDYPDSVIPIVSIFKNLCLTHSSVRQHLSCQTDVFHFVLRGMFLFFTEERMREDSVILTFLLVFKDCVNGSPGKGNFSIPHIVQDKLMVPFSSATHLSSSSYTQNDLREIILTDRWCLSAVQIQWNCNTFDGFHELVKWHEPNEPIYTNEKILTLNTYDLYAIKMSSIDSSIDSYLAKLQNGSTHDKVVEAINLLTLYVSLYKISNEFKTIRDNQVFISHNWEQALMRFYKIVPSTNDDVLMLTNIVNFTTTLYPFYVKKSSDTCCWISSLLKQPTLCLFDILSVDINKTDDEKTLAQEILKLITVSVTQEQHYLDFYVHLKQSTKSPWLHIIKTIAENLKFGDTQHFYNLAYLDSLLSCLVHLTATLGWSETKYGGAVREPLPQIVSGISELISAFHCGKGASAAISVMGLSITRHAVLILNHVLSELQNTKAKGWENHFCGNFEESTLTTNIFTLWGSRDVVLRAAAMQLFSRLAVSIKAAGQLLNDFSVLDTNFWQLTLCAIIDVNEAAIVRENAANLLANLVSHTQMGANNSLALKHKNFSIEIMKLLEESEFFIHLELLFNNSLSVNTFNPRYTSQDADYFSSTTSSQSNEDVLNKHKQIITTPSLIKNICTFLYNIVDITQGELAKRLCESGLIPLIFGLLCSSFFETLNDTRQMALYCDTLEMNTVVILLLSKLAAVNDICHSTIIHARDIVRVMLSLLDSKLYHIDRPQLVYLRNKLWGTTFNFIAILTDVVSDKNERPLHKCHEIIDILTDTIRQLKTEPFFVTMCDSLLSFGSDDLQNAALQCLTSLLKLENKLVFELDNSTNSLHNLLETFVISHKLTLIQKEKHKTPSTIRKEESTMLEQTYFGNIMTLTSKTNCYFDSSQATKSVIGAELSRILICLYDICQIDTTVLKKKQLVISSLTCLLSISQQAKAYALNHGLLLQTVIKQLRDCHIKLSLESVEYLRRVTDKKRLCPLLRNMNDLIGLLTNFMIDNDEIKVAAAELCLADVVHKLWVWFAFQNVYLIDVLRMLCVFTTHRTACQTLPYTSAVAGAGPRKTPSNNSLLHIVISLVVKEMELISKTHDLRLIEYSFNILVNCCTLLECRVLISKSNILQSITRLHPSITKRQKIWENVETMWLEFLESLTEHPEGQSVVAKCVDSMDMVMTLTGSASVTNRQLAMLVLRNLAFYSKNRLRLLSTADLLTILHNKLSNGTSEERTSAVTIIWALAANNQKTKLTFKSAEIDVRLETLLKRNEVLEHCMKSEDITQMNYVLSMLRRNDKVR